MFKSARNPPRKCQRPFQWKYLCPNPSCTSEPPEKAFKNPDGISYVMALGRAILSQRILAGFLEGSNVLVYSGLRAPGGSEGKVTVRDGVKVASSTFP